MIIGRFFYNFSSLSDEKCVNTENKTERQVPLKNVYVIVYISNKSKDNNMLRNKRTLFFCETLIFENSKNLLHSHKLSVICSEIFFLKQNKN